MSVTVDLPYSCEYAKSGRASCKKCKEKIDKDVLRMAVMVQSPFFDGKQPNWHHFDCFFQRFRPGGPEDIQDFDKLKFDDQKLVEKKIEEVKNGPSVSTSSKGSKKRKLDKTDSSNGGDVDFAVEYAKSKRSSCNLCEEKIDKGNIRIGKLDRDSEDAHRFGPLYRWFHVECFVSSRDDLCFLLSGKSLCGIAKLEKDDQKMLASKLPSKEGQAGKKTKIEKKKEDIKEDKSLVKEEKSRKKQSEALHKCLDELKKLRKCEIGNLFSLNGINNFGKSLSDQYDMLADALTFGKTEKCPECGGYLFFRVSRYVCNGNVNEWGKCSYTSDCPKRSKMNIPEPLKKYDFFKNYKFKSTKRIINSVLKHKHDKKVQDQLSSMIEVKKEENNDDDNSKILSGYHFSIIGSKRIKSKIIEFGGKYKTEIDRSILCAIADPQQYKKLKSDKLSKVEEYSIPLVSEDFFTALSNQVTIFQAMVQTKITFWDESDDDVEQRVANLNSKSKFEKGFKSGKKSGKSGPSVEKLVVKGGAAVDPKSELQDDAHIYREGNDIFNAVLNLVDITSNKNSFYKIQLLEDDKTHSKYWVFKSWGRIGTNIGGSKLRNYANLYTAKEDFTSAYYDQTKNEWHERKYFKKFPKCYYPVDIDYGDCDELKKIDNTSDVESKLPKSVQDLILLIFDVQRMKETMIEFELDTEKMPLGKLSKSQLTNAMSTLKEISNLIVIQPMQINKLTAACNKFYSLLPHNFGKSRFPLISTEEVVAKKNEMLESLMKIELAYDIIRVKSDKDENEIDFHYNKLNCYMEPLDTQDSDFEMIRKYIKNTHAATHDMYQLEVVSVLRVNRSIENKRFKKFSKDPNRMLLWHGSRLTNYVGILSQGLRIAPPEAPCTGYMFGKGVYFADSVSKSANYCCTSPTGSTGLLLLSEVALGQSKELTTANYIEKLESEYLSVKGVGNSHPNPAETLILSDGVKVPLGKLKKNKTKSSLLYNEYIVYNEDQIKLRYLVNVKFNYKTFF